MCLTENVGSSLDWAAHTGTYCIKKWSEVKWNGERFFKTVKGFIILEISLESVEQYYV